MPAKDPTNWNLATWILAILMASAGGLVNWYHHYKQQHPRTFNLFELVGQIFTSAFVGLGVFMAVQSLDGSVGLSAMFGGVGGHMANRLLSLTELWIENEIRKRL